MSGARTWPKANGPAFAPGEQWVRHAGKIRCKIVSVRKFGDDKWDFEVTYEYEDGVQHSKDAWNFQVRYGHVADKELRV